MGCTNGHRPSAIAQKPFGNVPPLKLWLAASAHYKPPTTALLSTCKKIGMTRGSNKDRPEGLVRISFLQEDATCQGMLGIHRAQVIQNANKQQVARIHITYANVVIKKLHNSVVTIRGVTHTRPSPGTRHRNMDLPTKHANE